MPLKSSLRYLGPAHLAAAASVARACPAARRLLRGTQVPLPPVPEQPLPYNHQLLRRLRRVARGAGRLVAGGREGSAVGTIAAFLVLRRTGWPVSVEIAGARAQPAARLCLWGVPVLGELPGEAEPDRVIRSGPQLAATRPRLPAVPSIEPPFQASGLQARSGPVSKVSCEGTLGHCLSAALEPLGGISAAVAPGQSVLLKPNFNSYHPSPASTRFDLLSATIELLREAGAGEIAVGECSAIALSPTRGVVRRAGLVGWAEERQVDLILFDEHPWRPCPVPGRHYRHILVPESLQRFDRLIYLISAKTHRQAGVSLSLKMGVGLMHPVQRIALHADHLPERIAETSLAVRPDLILADARQCFVSGGPDVGEVREPGLLLASADPEALDETLMDVLAAHGATDLAAGQQQVDAARNLRSGVTPWTG